jgi:hypothetical protein
VSCNGTSIHAIVLCYFFHWSPEIFHQTRTFCCFGADRIVHKPFRVTRIKSSILIHSACWWSRFSTRANIGLIPWSCFACTWNNSSFSLAPQAGFE